MFRHGSLFSGIGGFDLVSEWMGWDNIFQVEIDKYCTKVLEKNFPNVKRYDDIKEFDGTKYRGFIDIISGGFPCQPFSQAGKRKGTEDDRYLWPEMLRIIREVKPSFVIGENVAGLISMENGKTLDGILSDLENKGYQTEQVIIPACGVGAWHRRDRIWIIAYSKLFGGSRIGQYDRENVSRERTAKRNTKKNDVPDTHKFNNDHSGSGTGEISQQQETKIFRDITSNSNSQGFSSFREPDRIRETERKACTTTKRRSLLGREWNPNWGDSEPSVGRVANGIPNRVDRLKGLGNAIVPQVAFEIFKAIEQFALSEKKV